MSSRSLKFGDDLQVLWHLLRGNRRGTNHAERLQNFYAPQAAYYDAFRERLLHGRAELIEALDLRAGHAVIELGAGTGRNVEFYAETATQLAHLELVDLCPALLALARARLARWPQAHTVEADITYHRPARIADRVYFAYALSMVPNFFAALTNAMTMLKPGGLLGVVDFYVSRAAPRHGCTQHSAFTRHFWPWWFRHDGVHLRDSTLPCLMAQLEPVYLREGMGSVPYLPGLKVPYYVYVGRRR